jgi:hypothetical protein
METITSSTPYAWPFDAVVADDRVGFVVAGFDPYWCGSSLDITAVAAGLGAVAEAVANGGGTVVTLAHPPARRSPAAMRAPAPIESAHHLLVGGLDGCYGSALEPCLRTHGVEHVLVAGYGLEAPVHSTLRGLNDRGYECLLVSDACAPLDRGCVAGAISSIEMSGGIFGAVSTTLAVVSALRSTSSPASERTPR